MGKIKFGKSKKIQWDELTPQVETLVTPVSQVEDVQSVPLPYVITQSFEVPNKPMIDHSARRYMRVLRERMALMEEVYNHEMDEVVLKLGLHKVKQDQEKVRVNKALMDLRSQKPQEKQIIKEIKTEVKESIPVWIWLALGLNFALSAYTLFLK